MSFGPFTSWEPLLKGIESDQNLISLAEMLETIPPSFLKFTAINPDGSLEESYLGSAEGNTKFLLGLCSPGFHLAPYHFQFIYPALTPEQAEFLYESKGHPCIPELWVDSGNIPMPEGDIKTGKPHPFFEGFSKPKNKSPTLLINKETHILDTGSRELTSIASQVTYPWEVVQSTPHFYLYPELANQVVSMPEDTNFENEEDDNVPEFEESAEDIGIEKGLAFKDDCYPLVKTAFPKPGTVVKLDTNLFGFITKDSVKFIDRFGKAASFSDFELAELSLLDDEITVTQEPLVEFAHMILGKKLENSNNE
jgi:hypothetical protein